MRFLSKTLDPPWTLFLYTSLYIPLSLYLSIPLSLYLSIYTKAGGRYDSMGAARI